MVETDLQPPASHVSPSGSLQEGNRIPLEFITIPARKEHTATVIWLHGLGDSGRGITPLAAELNGRPELGHIKWILPHAREMPVTGNGGMIMNSWFDCYSFDIPNRLEDEVSLYETVALINDIVSAEGKTSNIPSERIIVGGFSQGSAVSMLLGLTTQRRLAGIFILSGYIPLRKKTKEIASPIAHSLPIFWGHGRIDQQVGYQFSVNTAETLASDLGIPFHTSDIRLTSQELASQSGTSGLRFFTYGWMGHSINDPETDDLAVWISAYLPDL